METKYVPLYRKYRPQTFSDLIGQENIVHALSNAIKLNRISHAYLLCGPRGTGKTSSARILAKSLNCQEGPTLTPCGKCPACLDIINSVPVDVVEIDAASNRSVEDTQAILEKIQYVPVNGRYKIYIIDEVHMLSATAFNSLLKTLEEPPENVIFILATTEPHKVLDTIISRCQRFDFRRITTEDIVKRLQYISERENINISKEALYAIAKNSQGGMRDALALLDQISVLGVNKQIDVSDVNEITGKISYDTLCDITDLIINGDTEKAVEAIDKIYSKGSEPLQTVVNLVKFFRDIMIVKNCSDKEIVYSLTAVNEAIYEKIKERADKLSVSEIIALTEKLAYYASQIKDSTDKYLWLELCIIDAANYKNFPSAESLLRRVEELEAKIASGNIAISAQPVAHIAPVAPVAKPEFKKPDFVKTAPSVAAPEQPESTPVEFHAKKPAEPIETGASAPSQSANPAGNGNDLHSLWVSILQSIDGNNNRAFYSGLAKPVEITDNKIVISFSKEMFVKQAQTGAKRQALEDAVKSYFNVTNPVIEIITGNSSEPAVKTVVPPVEEKKNSEPDIIEREEEEYNNYLQMKKETENKPEQKNIDTSSTAAMVKDLFCGKYLD